MGVLGAALGGGRGPRGERGRAAGAGRALRREGPARQHGAAPGGGGGPRGGGARAGGGGRGRRRREPVRRDAARLRPRARAQDRPRRGRARAHLAHDAAPSTGSRKTRRTRRLGARNLNLNCVNALQGSLIAKKHSHNVYFVFRSCCLTQRRDTCLCTLTR